MEQRCKGTNRVVTSSECRSGLGSSSPFPDLPYDDIRALTVKVRRRARNEGNVRCLLREGWIRRSYEEFGPLDSLSAATQDSDCRRHHPYPRMIW